MSSETITKLLNAESLFFSVLSLQSLFNLTRESARTKASRLVKRGILVRLQRDLYTLANRKYSLFSLANALHQPSVIIARDRAKLLGDNRSSAANHFFYRVGQ